MKRLILFWIFVLVINPVSASGVFHLSSLESTRVESSPNQDVNYGGNYQLRVGKYNDPVMRSLIKFNLSEIPDLIITKVELELYSIGGSDNPNIGVYTSDSDWNESKVTWSTVPQVTTLLVNDSVGSTGVVDFDITDFAKSNDGVVSFILKSMDESLEESYRIFLSDENTYNYPELKITYDDHKPVINKTVIFPATINEGDSVNISFDAYDIDSDISYYKIFIDDKEVSETNQYVWKTDYEMSGNHILKFLVVDGTALNDTKEVGVVINNVKNIVINEFSPLAKWVELYNPTDENINVSSCIIKNGLNDISLNGIFQNKSFFLIQNIPEIASTLYIECNGTLVDKVSQSVLPTPNETESLGRKTDGLDTDSPNDFKIFSNPSPDSSNPDEYNEADINHDGCISLSDLMSFVEVWKHSPDMGLDRLLAVVNVWKESPLCGGN